MKERPVIFSSEMIRAVLDGKKSQARQVVQCPRIRGAFVMVDDGKGWWPYQSDDGESNLCSDGCEHPYRSPFGNPGDRLWVKEAWQQQPHPSDLGLTRADLPITWDSLCAVADSYLYRAEPEHVASAGGRPWKPSIHMPRHASRITLEIISVHVERLQDISTDDILAEGVTVPCDKEGRLLININAKHSPARYGARANDTESIFRGYFAALWASTHGDESWHTNPWVWVIKFRRVDEQREGAHED